VTSPLRAVGVVVALGALVAATGCAPSYRGEPFAGPLDVTAPAVAEGQRSFARHCQQCHPGAQAGLGPSIRPSPLLIRLQVRHGLGAMPAFDEDRLPDAELDAVIAYLMELDAHGRAARDR
jgi:mono/diheme cytochrome c family protein